MKSGRRRLSRRHPEPGERYFAGPALEPFRFFLHGYWPGHYEILRFAQDEEKGKGQDDEKRKGQDGESGRIRMVKGEGLRVGIAKRERFKVSMI